MTWRTSTQPGRSLVHVEVCRTDEAPAGVPAHAGQPEIRRDEHGRPADRQSAAALASLGGRARAEQLRLERLMGRVDLPEGHPVRPYRHDAADWRDAHLARLRDTVGGGEAGPAVQAIVSTAALQHAASRWLFDKSAVEQDAKLALEASRLADASRQNLLAAHELCAREASARPRRNPVLAAIEAAGRAGDDDEHEGDVEPENASAPNVAAASADSKEPAP